MFKPLWIKFLIWWPQICEETCNTSLSFIPFSVSLCWLRLSSLKISTTCIKCIHCSFLCLILLIIVLAHVLITVGVKCQIIPDKSRHPQLIPPLFNRSVHLMRHYSRMNISSSHINFCLSGFWRLLSLPTSHSGEAIAVGPPGHTSPPRQRSQGKTSSMDKSWFGPVGQSS